MTSEPQHQITESPFTDAERSRVRADAAPPIGEWGCLVPSFVAFAVALAWGGGALLGLFSEAVGHAGSVVGGLLGIVVLVTGARSLAREMRTRRATARRDLEGGAAEVIRVQAAQAAWITVGYVSPGPVLVLAIGENRLLLLAGKWIQDRALFAETGEQCDVLGGTYNALPAPRAFPAQAFTLRRCAVSGMVLGVHVDGPYIEPQEGEGVDGRGYTFPESALLDAKMSDAPQAIYDVLNRRVARAPSP